jgi:amino acid adenylation domain-containing protein
MEPSFASVPATARQRAPLAGEVDCTITGVGNAPAQALRSSVPEVIAQQVARTPDAIAVSYGRDALTYRSLLDRASQLAHCLIESGATPGDAVAICLPRSADLVVALLAVHEAGCHYVALDANHPPGLRASMLSDSKPRLAITYGALLDGLIEPEAVVRLDAEEAAIAMRARTRPQVSIGPDDLAAIIYTSGSTGSPKGVLLTHRNVLAVLVGRQCYEEQPGTLVLPFPFAFDVFLTFTVWTLGVGGHLVLTAAQLGADLKEIAMLVAEHRASHLVGPPHLHRALLDHDHGKTMRGLATAITGGEACPASLPADLRRVAPKITFISEYGATEASWGSFFRCVDTEPSQGQLPIGRLSAGFRLHALDENLRSLAPDTRGELYLGGDGVALGYLGRAAQTAEHFIPDPFGAEPGARLYRTGDSVQVRSEGEVVFLGRTDRQIKIRGHRVEIGEIEAVIQGHPEVTAAVVDYDQEAQRLTAFVTARPGVRVAAGALREHLQLALAEPVIPAGYVQLEAFPLTPNGKIDRTAMSGMAREHQPSVAPAPAVRWRTPMEAAVAQVWSEVLGRVVCGPDDNFFELGGHSLLCAQVAARLHAAFKVELGIRDLFAAPTIGALAAIVDGRIFGPGRSAPAQASSEQSGSAPQLVRVPRDTPLPMSSGQRRLWLLDKIGPDVGDYLACMALRLLGPLDEGALRRALDDAVAHYEILRTRYADRDEQLVQIIDPPAPLAVRSVDLTSGPAGALEALLCKEASASFDLQLSVPVRVMLVRLGAHEHVLSLVMHHIAVDVWSLRLVLDFVAARYEARVRGDAAPVIGTSIDYADFAVWQQARSRLPEHAQHVALASRRLADLTDMKLPTDRPHPATRDARGASVEFELPAGTLADVAALGRRLDATPFMVLLAAFNVLLYRYTGKTDIAVGTPVSNRPHATLENVAGFFVETLVLRGDITGGPAFAQVVERVRDDMLAALAYQDVQFDEIVRELAPHRDLRRNPLFQVMFSYQDSAPMANRIGPLELRPVPVGVCAAKFDLLLEITEQADERLVGLIEFPTVLFDQATVERMSGHFQLLLEAALRAPDMPVDSLPILSERERRMLLDRSGAKVDIPERGLHELVAGQCTRTPDAIAIVAGEKQIHYADLARYARVLSARLRDASVGSQDRVAVVLPRCSALPVALLAVLGSGAAYVPLDPDQPPARLTALIAEAGVRTVIGTGAISGVDTGAVPVLVVEPDVTAWPPVTDRGTWPVAVDPSEPAYAIYTSGSTGTPKAVLIPHRAIVNHVLWAVRTHGITPGERVLQKTTVTFDGAGWEIFAPLVSGATVVLATPGAERDAAVLVGDVLAYGVTVLQAVPSILSMIVAEPDFARCSSLRLISSAGEALSADLARQVTGKLGVELRNTYGPTECAIDVTSWTWPSFGRGPDVVPIGTPIDNIEIRILDRSLAPVPVGIPGELHVSGAGLASGYLNQPALTAARFAPDECASLPGARIYRTGDIARWTPDGTIEYLGRRDDQIKVRGIRVEISELESALRDHPSVAAAAVRQSPDQFGDSRVIGYVVGVPGAAVDGSQVRAHAAALLPEQLVPSVIMVLDRLPTTASGKVSRDALPAAESTPSDRSASYVAPRDAAEELVANVFANVLGIGRVGIYDDFFDVGGHSLLAMRAAARLRRALALDVPVGLIFDARTPARLAAALASRHGSRRMNRPTRVPRSQALPLGMAQTRFWIQQRLDPDSDEFLAPVALRLRGELEVAALMRAVDAIVDRHEVLRTRYDLVDGEPRQIIDPAAPLRWQQTDLSSVAVGERQHRLDELLLAWSTRPFDLAHETPLRAHLIRIADEEHLLAVVMHHIACDAWSLQVLARELRENYDAFRQGHTPQHPYLPIQYADFAHWQRRNAADSDTEREIDFWRAELDGYAPLELPADRPRPPVRRAEGAVHSFTLPMDLVEAVLSIGRDRRATAFMTLLAVYEVFLYRYTGRADFVVGVPVSGRETVDVENLIGCFVNTLPLRADVGGDVTFTDLLDRVRSATVAAYDHSRVPFDEMVASINASRDLSRTPLLDVMFSLEDSEAVPYSLAGLAVAPYDVRWQAAMSDLSLSLRRGESDYQAEFEYPVALFEAATIARMARYFTRLLLAIGSGSDQPVAALNIRESAHDATTAAASPTITVAERFAAMAAACPHEPAVIAGRTVFTYADLERRSAALARRLAARGIGAGDMVAVCVDRNQDAVVALLGTLRSGAAYVPIDGHGPYERIAYVIGDIAPRAILTNADPRPDLVGTAIECIDVGADEPSCHAGAEGTEGTHQDAVVQPDDLAYIIYTSGSTGRPKGVAVAHGGFAAHCIDQARSYGLGPGERLALMAPPSLDGSLDQMIAPLLVGAAVVVVDPRNMAPNTLVDELTAGAVTVIDVTPAYFRELLDVLKPGAGQLADLRLMVLGGDLVTYADAERWADLGHPARFGSSYGPTEATIAATMHIVQPDEAGSARLDASVPIGQPLPGSTAYVLDGNFAEAPTGVQGELHIGGYRVARGYHGLPRLTADRFVPDPYSATSGTRMYRTGDLVRRRPDGVLEFTGRGDRQVKIRGFRVELSEIEATLARHPGKTSALVEVRERRPGDRRLVGYLASRAGVAPAPADLVRFLRDRLPEYMVPTAWVILERFPMTANQKVDRNALPDPDWTRPELAGDFVAPQSDLEVLAAQVWATVLGVDSQRVGRHADFFELGGNSLLAMRALLRLTEATGISLSLRAFFEARTVSDLASALEAEIEQVMRTCAQADSAEPAVAVTGAQTGSGETTRDHT